MSVFVQQCPNELPFRVAPHGEYEQCSIIKDQIESSNKIINKLHQTLSPQGQAVVETLATILAKPNDQDVAVEIFNTLHRYFSIGDKYPINWRDIDDLNMCVEQQIRAPQSDIESVLSSWPQAEPLVYAILYLSMVSETLLDPVFWCY